LIELAPTGTPGLDHIFHGGIVKGSVALIQGTPGSGKTTLGLQFIYHGAKYCNEPGLVITFEQLPQQIYRDAAQMGLDLQKLEEESKVRVISTSPEVFRSEMQAADGMIQEQVQALGVKRLLVDSISHFQRLTDDRVELRNLVTSLLNAIRQQGCTTFFTQEIDREDTQFVAHEQYIADAVVRMHFATVNELERRRLIEVLKSRGQAFEAGKHSCEIKDNGLYIYPRPRPAARAETDPPTPEAAAVRQLFGIHGLDRMMGGGLLSGFSALIAGDAGTGKSCFGRCFLAEGIRGGERGLLVDLREGAAKIINASRSIGLDIRPMVEANQLSLIHESPVRLDPDRLFWRLKDLVEREAFDRVVIDSLTDLEPAIADQDRFRDYVYALTDLFGAKGITSIFIRQAEETPAERELVESDLSMVFDAIIAVRLRRIQDHIRKTLAILKLRATEHDTGVRQFKVTSDGVHVDTGFEGGTHFLRQLAKA